MPRQLDQLGLFDFTSLCPVCTKPIFKFRDAVKELNSKHPQRGSLLISAIVSDAEYVAHEAWVDHQIGEYADPKLIEEHENKR